MKRPGNSILVVNNDKDFTWNLASLLQQSGIHVIKADNGFDAISEAQKNFPRLIIFDSSLPKLNGIDSGRIIKKDPLLRDTLIYYLIHDAADHAAINELRTLADDCFLKPVNITYLAQRVNELFGKRNGHQLPDEKKESDLRIDRETYTVHYNGRELSFPKKEFELLFLLASGTEKVFTRKDIFKTVWNKDLNLRSARTIDVHIRKLREKLNGINIITVKGVGYKLSAKKLT